MKDILRRHHVLQEEIVAQLNKQIQMEAQASAGYLAMASWCDLRGYDNCAEFFFKASDEERGHQLKFFHYLVDMECDAVSPVVHESQHEFATLRSTFEKALEMEIAVSDAIHNLYKACRELGDVATEEFLRDFIRDQIEGEYVARRTLELFDVLGEDKIGLGMVEERVLHVEYKPYEVG